MLRSRMPFSSDPQNVPLACPLITLGSSLKSLSVPTFKQTYCPYLKMSPNPRPRKLSGPGKFWGHRPGRHMCGAPHLTLPHAKAPNSLASIFRSSLSSAQEL